MKQIFLLFLFLNVFTILFSQNNSYTFKGKVFDSNTKDPIPFVNFIYDTNKGFTANEFGFFEIEASSSKILVTVTSIGYYSQTVELNSSTKQMALYLQPKTEELGEVQVFYVDPEKELIQKVIQNIGKNYPNKLEKLKGKIIETSSSDSLFKDTLYYADYSVEFNKQNYANKHKYGNLKVLKGKGGIHKNQDSISAFFYGPLHNVHFSDLIMKRAFMFNPKNIDNFKMKITDTVTYDNLKLAKVNFMNEQFKGDLYIDLQSFALVMADYSGLGKMNLFESMQGFKRNRWYERVVYQNYDDSKWRLKFIHFKGSYSEKNESGIYNFYFKNNFIIQSFDSVKKPIPLSQTIDSNKVGLFEDNVSLTYSNDELKRKQDKIVKFIKAVSKFNSELQFEFYPTAYNSFTYAPSFLENFEVNQESRIKNSKSIGLCF